MREQKNLDKLFKEQFKNFEEAPRDIVWERIENELHKDKRKRRIIPIWWKLAGVAAILALLLTIGKLIGSNNTDTPSNSKVVDTNSQQKDSEDNLNSDELNESDKTFTDKGSNDLDPSSAITNQDKSTNTNDSQSQEILKSSATKDNNESVLVSTSSDNESNHTIVASTDTKNTSKNKASVDNTNTYNIQDTKQKNKINGSVESQTTVAKSERATKTDKEVNSNSLKKEQSEIDKLIKATTQSKATQVTSTTTEEKDEAQTVIDTTSVNSLIEEENAIEKAIAEANKDKEEETNEEEAATKRWSIAPNVAPVYFNTLGKGSSLDNQFVDNTKEGNVTVSYGIKGSYALGKKLKIRAGINKVDLGYSTNNVLVFDEVNSNPMARQMQNVDVNNMQANGTYVSANTLSLGNGPEILKAKEHASIDQQLGFIEVPVELEYSLLDKKFGLNLIGGFSTLFLNNNEVFSVENNGNRTLMGEATNIKDMSYSANFGIGVNYNISKQLRFNLEPTFKYQINTFSNTSGDFQPYFIGVYTGLSFKF